MISHGYVVYEVSIYDLSFYSRLALVLIEIWDLLSIYNNYWVIEFSFILAITVDVKRHIH